MCAVQQNIEHKLLIAQWDALQIAWHDLKIALSQFEIENNTMTTSHQ